MKSFNEWLKETDPQLEGLLGKAGALGLGMGGALAGGAAGLLAGGAAGGPAGAAGGALGGWLAGKRAGTWGAEKLFPKDTLELMKKRMKKK